MSTTSLSQHELDLVEQLKTEVEPKLQAHPELRDFCIEHTFIRYLRARQWNLQKATKMLQATLDWRLQYKPHLICFENIKDECPTGKTFIHPTLDKAGRPVLVFRPRLQNTKDHAQQMRFTIYLLEMASRMADKLGVHKMSWLIDIPNQTSDSAWPLSVSLQFNSILQNHYPERLGVAVVYHAPMLFSFTWRAIKPFVDSVTQQKLVFADRGKELKVMEPLFDMDKMESCNCGKVEGYIFNMEQFEKDCRAFDKEVEEEVARLTAVPKVKRVDTESDVSRAASDGADLSVDVAVEPAAAAPAAQAQTKVAA